MFGGVELLLLGVSTVASLYAALNTEATKRRIAEQNVDIREWTRSNFMSKDSCTDHHRAIDQLVILLAHAKATASADGNGET